ncbi:MAG: hypothetical protein ACTSP4_09875 [Candidatus Hodarchaeales archaeon]
MTEEFSTELKKIPAGISIKVTEDGLLILLKGERFHRLAMDIEAGRKMDFYRKLKKFRSEILSLAEEE